MGASALCSAFFTSNRIPLAACAGALSPRCVFRAAQTCHDEDSAMATARRAASAPAVESFASLIWPPRPSLALSGRRLISLFVLHQRGLLLENRPLRTCERIKGASNWGMLDKWRCQLAPHSAAANRTWLPSQRVAAGWQQAWKTPSAPRGAVKSTRKETSDNASVRRRSVRAEAGTGLIRTPPPV